MYISLVNCFNSESVHFMRTAFNPFKLNGISHHYQVVLGGIFIFIQVLIENYASKQWRP